MPAAKLAVDQQEQVAKLYLEGSTGPDLAGRLGVGSDAVYAALRRRGVAIRGPELCARRYGFREDAFDEVNESSSYWAGFLTADGCLYQDCRGTWILAVELGAKDRAHLVKFLNFMESNKPIHRRTRLKFGRSTSTTCSVAFNSKRLVDALARWGVVPGKVDSFPTLVRNRHFWRGMVDGDGWVRLEGATPLVGLCGTPSIVREFIIFVRQHEPGVKVHPQDRPKLSCTAVKGAAAVRILKALYGHSNVALDRKKARAEEILWKYSFALNQTGRARWGAFTGREVKNASVVPQAS